MEVVAQPTKHGFVVLFNRETGEPIWPIEERPVPQSDVPGEQSWPTQPFPTAPPPFGRQSFTVDQINPFLPEQDKARLRQLLRTYRNEGLFTPPSLQGSIQMPGNSGGGNWGSAAVNPAAGTLFIVSKELPAVLKLLAPQAGGGGRGGAPGGGGQGGAAPAPASSNDGDMPAWGMSGAPLVDSDRLICLVGDEPDAKVVALDKLTGKEIWRASRLRAWARGYRGPP